jgi:hypothetical protein
VSDLRLSDLQTAYPLLSEYEFVAPRSGYYASILANYIGPFPCSGIVANALLGEALRTSAGFEDQLTLAYRSVIAQLLHERRRPFTEYLHVIRQACAIATGFTSFVSAVCLMCEERGLKLSDALSASAGDSRPRIARCRLSISEYNNMIAHMKAADYPDISSYIRDAMTAFQARRSA